MRGIKKEEVHRVEELVPRANEDEIEHGRMMGEWREKMRGLKSYAECI